MREGVFSFFIRVIYYTCAYHERAIVSFLHCWPNAAGCVCAKSMLASTSGDKTQAGRKQNKRGVATGAKSSDTDLSKSQCAQTNQSAGREKELESRVAHIVDKGGGGGRTAPILHPLSLSLCWQTVVRAKKPVRRLRVTPNWGLKCSVTANAPKEEQIRTDGENYFAGLQIQFWIGIWTQKCVNILFINQIELIACSRKLICCWE